MKQIQWLTILLLQQLLIACTPDFEDINHTVIAVHEGQILELKNGVFVNLIGVEGNKTSQQYLEQNLLHQKVNITFDTKNYPLDLSPGQTIYAYVNGHNGVSVNGELLRDKITNLSLSNESFDSLDIFKYYVNNQLAETAYQSSDVDKSFHSNEDYSSSETQTGLSYLVGNVEKSVFLVSTFDDNGNNISQGTGFLVGQNGYGVSNYHVFENGTQWQITTSINETYNVSEVIRANKEFDYVIFKIDIDHSNFTSLRIANNRNPKKAEDIFVVGNPHGLESTFTKGVVSALRSINEEGDIIQFDAAISSGSSGSPVMNMKGEVLGIATMKYKDCENCNFAINIHLLNIN